MSASYPGTYLNHKNIYELVDLVHPYRFTFVNNIHISYVLVYFYQDGPATSIQEQKYAVFRTLPVLKSGTVFVHRLKCHFLISFSFIS